MSASSWWIGVVVAIVVMLGLIRSDNGSVDLISGRQWQPFAQTGTTTGKLLVRPFGRVIVHQDGSLAQPNPLVYLTGPHLAVSGDFVLSARMEKIDSLGRLQLYGKPPIVYDQWRYETGSIAIDVGTSSIVVRVWDGSASSPLDMRSYPFTGTGATDISIEHRGDAFVMSADARELGTIPDHHIFDTKEVWFGADAAQGDEWVLAGLTANPLRGGRVSVVSPPSFEIARDNPDTLRAQAAFHPRKLRIGAAVSFGALATDEKYRERALGEFSMMTPENGMKPQFIHPQQGTYVFTEMDMLVDIARKNDMQVHGHTLVYAKSNPEWMTEVPKERRQNIMTDHIATIAGHFKGAVAEWDVVNEPLSDKRAPYRDARRGLENNPWYDAMGEQYIDKAFRAAREADPSAVLYLNEYGLERDGERWDALLGLVKRLKSRGVPIDGVGFESHVYGDGDYNDAVTLRAHMKTLAALGLKVRISEIDVTGDDPKKQINQYVLALDACLRAPNCTSYTTWGITDAYGSTTRSDRYPLVYGTSLLWDTEMKRKPAYAALQDRLRRSY